MGSFLSGIFTGANPTLDSDINNAGNVMNFSTGTGEGDVGNASAFYNTLLSGDPAAEAKLLAPEIKTIQDQGQQKINTTAEFGNRSGGTNAGNQTTMDTSRANVDDMISKLTGQAAAGDASLGENLLNTGLNANQLQDEESQQKLNNEQQSLLGGVISKGVTGGLGKIPGLSSIF